MIILKNVGNFALGEEKSSSLRILSFFLKACAFRAQLLIESGQISKTSGLAPLPFWVMARAEFELGSAMFESQARQTPASVTLDKLFNVSVQWYQISLYQLCRVKGGSQGSSVPCWPKWGTSKWLPLLSSCVLRPGALSWLGIAAQSPVGEQPRATQHGKRG